jgi:hypothetical protein
MSLVSQLLKITLGFVWLLVNVSAFPLSSFATPKISNDGTQLSQSIMDQTSSDWRKIVSDPPPTGGGPRNPCGGQVTALIPIIKDEGKTYYGGYTAQALPTFWFHVPYKPGVIKSSKFFLRYRGGRLDYDTNLKTTASGIIQVSLLSSKIKELALGEWYEAELQIKASCIQGEPSQTISSSFWVKRKDLSVPIGSNLSPQQQIAFYKKEEMWFEALDVAIRLERKKPGNLDWQGLLSSAGLRNIVGQPILDCCSPQPSQPQSR